MMQVTRIVDVILNRKRCYQALFLDLHGKPNVLADKVLRDLARFCSAHRPAIRIDKEGRVDPVASALVAGRHEVWLRLMEQLHLDERTITNLREVIDDAG